MLGMILGLGLSYFHFPHGQIYSSGLGVDGTFDYKLPYASAYQPAITTTLSYIEADGSLFMSKNVLLSPALLLTAYEGAVKAGPIFGLEAHYRYLEAKYYGNNPWQWNLGMNLKVGGFLRASVFEQDLELDVGLHYAAFQFDPPFLAAGLRYLFGKT